VPPAGVDAHVGSVLDLPFADGSFDAVWTMSTLLHVPDESIDRALTELVRVCWPGGPLAIGVWAGDDVEGPLRLGDLDAPRFF
jgi:ubiquinone/menaquinone biosynthesis C-methylase UbiE